MRRGRAKLNRFSIGKGLMTKDKGQFGHIPVLAEPIAQHCPAIETGTVVDCTVGSGGHSELLLERLPAPVSLIALDADPGSLEVARGRLERFASRVRWVHARFGSLAAVLDELGAPAPSYIVADLGISSRQISAVERGFSFGADGPLDMRFDPTRRDTAADLLARLSEKDLADLIFQLGEERFSRRIARRIVEERSRSRITTASRLADLVRGAYPAPARRNARIDPATRTFQALRMAVNDELGELTALLRDAPARLAVGGRLAVISFHSLEDRPVKHTFRELEKAGGFEVLTRKPIEASDEEVGRNPRSRSAKLRILQRISG